MEGRLQEGGGVRGMSRSLPPMLVHGAPVVGGESAKGAGGLRGGLREERSHPVHAGTSSAHHFGVASPLGSPPHFHAGI